MENKNFNITEILESVDSIVGNKKKIVETKKQFDIKKFDTTFNKETEKIIIDAEKAQDDRKLNNKSSEVLILNNGYFCKRMTLMAERLKLNFSTLDFKWGTAIDLDILEDKLKGSKIKLVAAIIYNYL